MDNRKRMANQLLMRGWATMDQLLEASFGEWPPRGLDIVHDNPQRVNLTSSLTEFRPKTSPLEMLRDYLMVGGYARIHGDRKIFINRLMYPLGGFTSTLGHEAAHILQGDHYWRADDIMGKDGQQAYYPRQNTNCEIIIDNSISGHFQTGALRRIFNAVADMTGFGIAYYQRGVEIQARLHEALMQGYPKWQRMPQNHMEFYYAMHSLGFELTPDIRTAMDAHPQKEQMKTLFMDAHNPLQIMRHSFVADIAKVEANLSAKGRENLWDMGMPALYCDLIEMYGDKQGRERFGYGVNETHMYRQRHSDDRACIKDTAWQYSSNDQVGRYAFIQLDQLEQTQKTTLLAALDNQYIATQLMTEQPPHSRTFLFVSGERWMKKLERIINTDQPAAPKQAAIQRSIKR